MDRQKREWFCICGLFLISVLSTTIGLQVTIPQSTYEVARGDKVTIPCNFKPKNPVNPLIIITWTGDPDGSSDDEGILFGTFYSHDGHVDIDPKYVGRVTIESDVSKTVSHLILKQVTMRESRRIKCRVQIPGDDEGQTTASTNLVVLVAPSDPVCKIKGTAEYGYNITLNCESEEGSPTPTYKWESYDARNNPRSFPPRTTEKDGVLSLFNVSADTSGYYICTASNQVRSAKCNLTLSVMPSTMKIGTTVGILGGCIAGIAILAVIIYCCCKDKEKPDDVPMGSPEIGYIKTHDDDNGERDLEDPGKATENFDQREFNEAKFETKQKLLSSEDSDRNSNRRFDDRPEADIDHKETYSRDRYDDRSDRYDDRSDRYDDRRDRYENRRDRYDDRRDRSDDRSERYDDRRDRPDDHQYRRYRSDEQLDRPDDRRYRSEERLDRYDDRRYRSDERLDRYDDRRDRSSESPDRYHDRRDRYDDSRDRYNDRKDGYDDRY